MTARMTENAGRAAGRRAGLLLALLLLPAAAGAVRAAPAAADTVRTNLWLARALLTEAARDMLSDLPAGCRSVEVVAEAEGPATALFEPILFAVLRGAGITVYSAADRDSQAAPAADHRLRYRLEQLSLAYPAQGRTFGLWRSWLDRELAVTAVYKVVRLPDGLVLAERRRVHRYADRIRAGDRVLVESDLYPFTAAEPPAGRGRALLEQTLVIGTLVGMVAAYFANTGS